MKMNFKPENNWEFISKPLSGGEYLLSLYFKGQRVAKLNPVTKKWKINSGLSKEAHREVERVIKVSMKMYEAENQKRRDSFAETEKRAAEALSKDIVENKNG